MIFLIIIENPWFDRCKILDKEMLFMDSIYLSNRYISYINPKATLVVIYSLMLLFFAEKFTEG